MRAGWEAYPTGDRRGLSRRKIAMAEPLLWSIAAAITEAESSVASGFWEAFTRLAEREGLLLS